MKRVFYLLVVLLITSCSTNDDALRENNLCDCERVTITYENDQPDATVLGTITETLQADCNSEDESYFTENGYYVEVTWNCQ